MLKLSRRVTDLPPYLFAEVDKARDAAIARGLDVISLGIGDPDIPTPLFVRELMKAAVDEATYHRYPPYRGYTEYLNSIAEFCKRRFGYQLNPSTEVICCMGGKDAVAHFPWALLDPGDLAIVPDPVYPICNTACEYAGARIYHVPLREENGFLPDVSSIPVDIAREAKLMFINYPNNPTGACADLDFYRNLIEWALKWNVIILVDNPYSEVYYSEDKKPHSILEIDGAKEIAVEMHSFSKTFNMTGWRIGFTIGNADIVNALLTVKTNVDSGIWGAQQRALAQALTHPDCEPFMKLQRDTYRNRRDIICDKLTQAGVKHLNPDGAFYVWCNLPQGWPESIGFASELLNTKGVVVAPGAGYGANSEGYFRISLCINETRLIEAGDRIIEFINHR